MRAAVVVDPEAVEIQERPIPTPSPREVLVRLEGSGLCASSLPLWQGRAWFDYPLAPGQGGHEGWGCIQATGREVIDLKVGDRVALLSNHAFAEYDVAPADAVVKLPPALDGQPFPGEPIGCALNILERSNVQAGQNVAIVGIGFLGALLTRLAAQAGARVIAISRRPYALEMARQFGAAETVAMNDHPEIIRRVMTLTNERGCERVIEATGVQWALDIASELTGERGRLVIAGYHQDGTRQVDMQLWNWRGLDVVNAHERDPRVYVKGMRAAIRAVEGGMLDPMPLYTTFALENLAQAFETLLARPDGFVKALVVP